MIISETYRTYLIPLLDYRSYRATESWMKVPGYNISSFSLLSTYFFSLNSYPIPNPNDGLMLSLYSGYFSLKVVVILLMVEEIY